MSEYVNCAKGGQTIKQILSGYYSERLPVLHLPDLNGSQTHSKNVCLITIELAAQR